MIRRRFLVAGGPPAAWCVVAALAAAQPAPGAPPQAKGDAARAAARPASPAKDAGISPEAAEWFEKEIRPVLAEQCFSCHGPKVSQAGLRLDTHAGLLRGLDNGRPAVVPGAPDRSPLIAAVRYDGRVKMPPQGRLPQKAIDALTEWIKMGAPWPSKPADAQPGKTSGAGHPPGPSEARRAHWAFQPVRRPPIPAVKNRSWVRTPIDSFVLAKLEAKGMSPAPPADRRTLIRRAYLDLTGLPPTFAEVEEFVRDRSPQAWEKVIDRLLASPQYGERWGRYWLDVARYADSKGYVFQEERRYPFAYTYRDWVVRALNEDMPYDRFLVNQIAADHAAPKGDNSPLAALGFLTLGRRFLNNQADIIDDRIDVVFRGTQALTVGCARCHDHKFDPVPTRDYYSIYGVFASSTEPRDLPLLAQPERTEAYLAYERQLNALQGEVDRYLDQKSSEVLARARTQIAECLLAARETRGGRARRGAARVDLPFRLIGRWSDFLEQTGKSHHPIFSAWHDFAAIPDAEFASKAPEVAARIARNEDRERRFHPLVARAFEGPPPASLRDAAERFARVLNTPSEDQQIKHALDSIGGPLNVPRDQIEQLFNRAERDRLRALQQQVDRFRATSPVAPPRAMALVDLQQPVTPRIFLRGNPQNPGDEVPRQFLAVLSGPERQPFRQGSGRLELARAIASPENPLTARVMVNRVWGWHFGAGLVRTPSDFGLRSEPPSHPELLDWLASQFIQDGWSLKRLHRLIMRSSVYLQASTQNPRYARIDPENTLLWRSDRRRLDFEAMRDSLLAASGQLDPTVGGPAVEITSAPFSARRTLYGFIDRQNLPGLFRMFDFASPDTHSPQRFRTTVPQQALFLMNSPFVVQSARKLVGRAEVAAEEDVPGKVRSLYRLVYARDPKPEEVQIGARFLKDAEAMGTEVPRQEPVVWQYGYGSLDEAAGRVRDFRTLHWAGEAWQGGKEYPHPTLGFLRLTRTGGHPGNDARQAVIRRWIAPRAGTVRITGTVSRPSAEGDGIRAAVVSSRTGIAGAWTLERGSADAVVERLEVAQGDTIDFVVECRGAPTNDSFNWAPLIRLSEQPMSAEAHEWSANAGFGGPPAEAPRPLTPWEKYAQALLVSNEFLFVD